LHYILTTLLSLKSNHSFEPKVIGELLSLNTGSTFLYMSHQTNQYTLNVI